jgi:hypothetical protein
MGLPNGYVGTCRGSVLHNVYLNFLFRRCSIYVCATSATVESLGRDVQEYGACIMRRINGAN